MTGRSVTVLLSVSLLWAFTGAACIGVSQKRAGSKSSGSSTVVNAPLGTAALAAAGIKTCPGGTRPAEDGDLDDFEDRDAQLTKISGRDGYWWTKKDDQGSTVEPKPLRPQEGGAGGSRRAMHATGETSAADGAWGAGIGANFSAKNPYDGSRYVGIAFKAKLGTKFGPKGTRHFRFKIGDINTHKDAAVCTDCWNHFGQDFDFTEAWTEYQVLFSEAAQEPHWGTPRPPTLTPSKLYSLDWSIGPGQAFDLWIDDITFLVCKS